MSSKIQEFIQTLVNKNEMKISLCDFFKIVHSEFYSDYDISFMEYFLELTTHEGEFVVHHEKLIEYGIVTSGRSSTIKEKLNTLGLVEDEDFSLLQDVLQQWEGSRGIKHTKVYMLTPEAFKKCLMRAQRRPAQKIDPVVYCDYYLLLEKTYKLYTDYEKQLLVKQLEHQAHQIETQAHQIETQAHQIETQAHQIETQAHQIEQTGQELEDQKNHVLRLNEMLVDSSNLPKTQVVYIATSSAYANQNRFKVGGVESLDKLVSRLSVYNTGSANGDMFYYADWFLVHNYKDIESRLKDLMGRFRDQKSKEMYVVHYTKLLYILEYLINNYNEEVDIVNAHLVEFISSLDKRNLKPVVPKEKCLKSIKIKSVGQPTIKIEANTDLEIVQKLEDHFRKMNIDTKSVTFKSIFDKLDIKKDRLKLYPKLLEIGEKIRPDVVVKKK
jgi:hypothetical protein